MNKMDGELLQLKRTGNRLLAARDYTGAEATFRQLVSHYPDSEEGYLGLTKLYERDLDYDSIVTLVQPVHDRIGSWKLTKVLGDAYRVLANRGNHEYVDLAIKYYVAYHQKRTDPVTLYYLGDIFETQKKDFLRA